MAQTEAFFRCAELGNEWESRDRMAKALSEKFDPEFVSRAQIKTVLQNLSSRVRNNIRNHRAATNHARIGMYLIECKIFTF